jgi:hypothetical protein
MISERPADETNGVLSPTRVWASALSALPSIGGLVVLLGRFAPEAVGAFAIGQRRDGSLSIHHDGHLGIVGTQPSGGSL